MKTFVSINSLWQRGGFEAGRPAGDKILFKGYLLILMSERIELIKAGVFFEGAYHPPWILKRVQEHPFYFWPDCLKTHL